MSLTNYIKETKAELGHVTWPNQNQIIAYTAVVIGISLVTAVALGLFDGVYAWLLEKLISAVGI